MLDSVTSNGQGDPNVKINRQHAQAYFKGTRSYNESDDRHDNDDENDNSDENDDGTKEDIFYVIHFPLKAMRLAK